MRYSITCSLLLALCVSLGQHTGVEGYTITYTSGASGDQCPPGPKCLSSPQASCIAGKCRCAAPNSGIGTFICHDPDEDFCAVFNDPEILAFDGTRAHAPLSCKFILTKVSTPICDTSDPSDVTTNITAGTCEVKVRGWGTRILGKTVMKGADIKIMVHYNGQDYHQATRIWSTAMNGIYEFYESTNHALFGGPTAGPAANLTIPGAGRIYTEYNNKGDNFARVVAEMCGFEFGIRGVDFGNVPRDESLVPGLYIKINRECQPNYIEPERMLCSSPKDQGPSLQDHADWLANQTGIDVPVDVAVMHLVLTDPTPQDFPGAAAGLQSLVDQARSCAAKSLKLFLKALSKCSFIMSDRKFLRCYDETDNLEQAVALMEMCIFAVCDENVFVCGQVQEAVVTHKENCLLRTTNNTIMEDECGFDVDLDAITRQNS